MARTTPVTNYFTASAAPKPSVSSAVPKPTSTSETSIISIAPKPSSSFAVPRQPTSSATSTISAVPKLTTAAYAVFLHRSVMKRKRAHFLKYSETKINLSDHLIDSQKQRIYYCSYQDVKFMAREQKFRNFLHNKRTDRLKAIKMKKLKRLQ